MNDQEVKAKTSYDVDELIKSFQHERDIFPFHNGYVMFILKSAMNGKIASKILMEQINRLNGVECVFENDLALYAALKRVNAEASKLRKNTRRNWPHIEMFMSKYFVLPKVKATKKVKQRDETNTQPEQGQENLYSDLSSSPTKTRTDCEKCPQMKKESLQQCSEIRKKLKDKKQQLKAIRQNHNVSDINKKLKRQANRIMKLTSEKKTLRKENYLLKKGLHSHELKLSKNLTDTLKKEKRKRSDADKRLMEKESEMAELKKEKERLEKTIKDQQTLLDDLRCQLHAIDSQSPIHDVATKVGSKEAAGPQPPQANKTLAEPNHQGAVLSKPFGEVKVNTCDIVKII